MKQTKETIEGLEGKCRLLEAFLACSILRDSPEGEESCTVRIPRDRLRRGIGKWFSQTTLEGEEYVIKLWRDEGDGDASHKENT